MPGVIQLRKKGKKLSHDNRGKSIDGKLFPGPSTKENEMEKRQMCFATFLFQTVDFLITPRGKTIRCRTERDES